MPTEGYSPIDEHCLASAIEMVGNDGTREETFPIKF